MTRIKFVIRGRHVKHSGSLGMLRIKFVFRGGGPLKHCGLLRRVL